MKSLISSMLVLVGFGSRVGNPEVISSPVGLVLITRIPSVLDFLTRCRSGATQFETGREIVRQIG